MMILSYTTTLEFVITGTLLDRLLFSHFVFKRLQGEPGKDGPAGISGSPGEQVNIIIF